ncbi:hypothetical protein LPJ38_34760 [Bradyrhizobium daqingense]|uniref:Uncharacterized protein n=1 Tax=Bradyrhizobium daqingense TaxID=993502 RepID=A0A562L314_9BRAD|nr:hypothetical protein [Bradyrhizobium daqingense]TWI02028.1 hypothetical protein IQ17_04388 [Bradyrhizobium daqingense]UFS88730.1 hypothetical protein LPJ38_34760 [Bradyrhizobium daqingense]
MTEATDDNYTGGLLAKLFKNVAPWCWDWKYNPRLFHHMHAMGVIAANYNELEGQFYRLFFLNMHKFEVGKLVFSKLNNAERMEVALKAAETEPLAFGELFEHFISGYGIATENRNILMHSKAHNAWPKEADLSHLTLAKASKKSPDQNNFISLDISELRNIANDIDQLTNFGFRLFMWRVALPTGGLIIWDDGEQYRPSLPDKPAPPRRLVLGDQPTMASTLPRSSSSGK